MAGKADSRFKQTFPPNVDETSQCRRPTTLPFSGGQPVRLERRHLFGDTLDRSTEGGRPVTYQDAIRAFQKRFLREALEASDWNIAETARWLDLARAHLDSLLKVSGIAAAWQC